MSLCPGPSLPETHFSETLGPLTTVYHHSAPYLDTPGYYKGPSSVRSADIMGGPGQGRDSGVSFLSSRSVILYSSSVFLILWCLIDKMIIRLDLIIEIFPCCLLEAVMETSDEDISDHHSHKHQILN